ncbi:MAG: protein kinase [Myxococcales bacterium]|nr:protein kinase [Myxococcales bacterium]
MGVDPSIPPEERYEIIGRIAAGGMAEIYLSRMLTANGARRECVLKRLMPELQSDHEFVQMFYDEANIASQLSHPNIVRIFELGELDGSLFIAMELLRGVNLRDLLARLHAQNQPIPIPIAVRIACSALEALDYAHRFADAKGRPLNVVHRDVSPQNIIVTYDGTVKLVDFGVAKAEGRLHQTRAGLIKGKFAYMSPEQVSGSQVDGRSDLFALAEVFYEILLKRHPFYANSDMEVLRAILDKDPPHPSSVDGSFPPELGELLMRAMRKAPGDRFASAGQMQDALERFLQNNRTPATVAMLGRFMTDLFADRVQMEQRARDASDDDALIDALTAGRAEEAAHHHERRRGDSSSVRARVVRDESGGDFPTDIPSDYGPRDRVVEISREPAQVLDPAERGAPAFIAHSGYTNPGVRPRDRFSSQVRGLFDEPDGPPPDDGAGPLAPADMDEGELPTMLGTLSARELQELRTTGDLARKAYNPGVTVGPPGRGRDTGTGVSVEPADPALVHAPRVTRGPVAPYPATPAPYATPVPSQSGSGVTPRSRTVVAQDDPPKSDRLGLVFFIAGLGALVGAIIYAVWLYTSSQAAVTELELRSAPSGASIYLDGADTGARTPHSFRNVVADRPHVIEFRMEGHAPCVRELSPSQEALQKVSCDLTPLSKE